jgi:hypothetical protein
VAPAATLGRFSEPTRDVDLRLTDARLLDRLPEDDVPVIVLGSFRGPPPDDPRLVGCVPRPAEVSTLYPLLQRALEPQPRRAARAEANLPARCVRADRRWSAEVLRLSEAGCLLEGGSGLSTGIEFNLSFPLPDGRMVSTRARVRTQTSGGAGLDFRSLSPQARHAIAEFVQRRLAIRFVGA